MTEEWTAAEAAAYMGLEDPVSARRKLTRWGVQPVSRGPGRHGHNRYNAEEVRRAVDNQPGQGRRTDLANEQQQRSDDA